VTTIRGVKYLLPDLQVQVWTRRRVVETAVHVQREFVGVGGLLNTNTLHPKFEAGVAVLDVTNRRRPSFRILVAAGDELWVELGEDGDRLHPIQYFEAMKGLLTMTWLVCCKSARFWALAMVDKLHTSMHKEPEGEHGFFTLEEYTSKRHTQSVLHLVMKRDAVRGKALVFAMLPVKSGETVVACPMDTIWPLKCHTALKNLAEAIKKKEDLKMCLKDTVDLHPFGKC
jgi:hypothetical protein